MLLGMMLGAALYAAAEEESRPVRTTTKITTYTSPRTTIIYSNGSLSHKIWDSTCYYESMSNSELELAIDRAVRRLPADIRNKIHTYRYRRTITNKTYISTHEVEISVNGGSWITVYYEAR